MKFLKFMNFFSKINIALAIFAGNLALAGIGLAAEIDNVLNDLSNVADRSQVNTSVNFFDITGRFINLFLVFLGTIFLILVIYAGLTWMTAGGNEEKVKKATDLISKGAIGLAIILAAYLFTNYLVFKQLTFFAGD